MRELLRSVQLYGLMLKSFLQQLLMQGRNVLVKAMADGGQGFLKICLSVDDIQCPLDESHRRWRHWQLQASVKRVILLCIVPDVKETHENMQLLFSLTSLNDILLHICLRLQTFVNLA